MTTTNQYYIRYPRGFANEYTIYTVSPATLADFTRIFINDVEQPTRITLDAARQERADARRYEMTEDHGRWLDAAETDVEVMLVGANR